MARGGYRKPANPAPVSTPGSGARTDGGAGQPIRLASQQAYGDRKSMESAQGAAPMAVAGTSSTPATAPTAIPTTPSQIMAGQGPLPTPGDVFGPTKRPNEPLGPSGTAPNQMGEMDADTYLRMLYAAYPNPYIARLMRP